MYICSSDKLEDAGMASLHVPNEEVHIHSLYCLGLRIDDEGTLFGVGEQHSILYGLLILG